MKRLLTILMLVWAIPALADYGGDGSYGSGTGPASQAEVNAGTVTSKFVSPATLAGGGLPAAAATAQRNVLAVFNNAGRAANLVDVAFFGAQFSPTNQRTLLGRSWTTADGWSNPLFGDPNWMYCQGTNGIQLNGLNLPNSFLIVVVYKLDPSAIPNWEVAATGGVNIQNSTCVVSALNTNDNSGVLVMESTSNKNGDYLAVIPRGPGAGTNNWLNSGKYGTTSTNSWKGFSASDVNNFNPRLRQIVALGGNNQGQFQLYRNDVNGLFNYGNPSFTNATLQSVAGTFPAGGITTIRIGAETNLNGSHWADLNGFINTNAVFDYQSVFVFNTNDPALVDLAYKASFYGDTRRNVALVYASTSIFNDALFDSTGNNFPQSTNGFVEVLQDEYQDTIWLNFAQGGASIGTCLTNGWTKSQFTSSPVTNVPAEFNPVVSVDGQRNDIANGNSINSVNGWVATLFAPVVAQNIPINVWEDAIPGTNSNPTFSTAQRISLLQWNISTRTNRFYKKSLDAARHVTNGSYTNSAADGTHPYLNGEVYQEIGKEWGGQGRCVIQFPDSFTSPSIGWTNLTAQTVTVYMSAGTLVQAKDAIGNTLFPSAVSVAEIFDLPPLGSFSGSAITANIITKGVQ